MGKQKLGKIKKKYLHVQKQKKKNDSCLQMVTRENHTHRSPPACHRERAAQTCRPQIRVRQAMEKKSRAERNSNNEYEKSRQSDDVIF